MAIKEIDFNYEEIKNKLMNEGYHGLTMISIIDFLNTEAVNDLIGEINSEFSSKYGKKAYPREILLGIFLYCYYLNITNLKDIEYYVQNDKIIHIFSCGLQPKYTTLSRFHNKVSGKFFKKIFLCTLLEANDYQLLKFVKVFIDSTDGYVNASKNYTLSLNELNMLKYLKKVNIMHNGKNKSKKAFKHKINTILSDLDPDDDLYKSLSHVLLHPHKYSVKMMKRISEFKSKIKESKKDYISINMPDAVMLKTKKGKFDFGFNIQQAITEVKLSIGVKITNKPNDHEVAEEVILDLIENFKILLELVKMYGKRRNYKELEMLLTKAIYIFDSGYFSEKNIQTLENYELNTIIMPKQLSRQYNNILRKKKNILEKIGKAKNQEKIFKKDFERVKNAYICPMGKKLKLVAIKSIKSRGKSPTTKKSFKHSCNYCHDCPLQDNCIKEIIDRTTPSAYNITNKMLDSRYKKIYGERFHIAEGINGYYKNTSGVVRLLGSDMKSVQNGLHLRNTMYNIIRIRNLKGTAY